MEILAVPIENFFKFFAKEQSTYKNVNIAIIFVVRKSFLGKYNNLYF